MSEYLNCNVAKICVKNDQGTVYYLKTPKGDPETVIVGRKGEGTLTEYEITAGTDKKTIMGRGGALVMESPETPASAKVNNIEFEAFQEANILLHLLHQAKEAVAKRYQSPSTKRGATKPISDKIKQVDAIIYRLYALAQPE